MDQSGAGDFVTIQAAIQAATDGDLILVRDTGTYAGFTLNKGVLILAEGASFDVNDAVVIDQVGAGLLAGVSGMQAAEPGDSAQPTVSVTDCLGEVVLEDTVIVRTLYPYVAGQETSLRVENSYNVALDGVQVSPWLFPKCPAVNCPRARPAVELIRSLVRCNDVQFTGPTGAEGNFQQDGGDGGHALLADHSLVYLANPVLVGGTGGFGGGSAGSPADHGDGGHALEVIKSQVQVLGVESDVIEGGEGPAGDPFGWNIGGRGGAGINLISGSTLVSRVPVMGGVEDTPAGRGPDFLGNVQRLDLMASLRITPDLGLNDVYRIDLDGIEPGRVLLVVANVSGFQNLPSYVGPALSALPGGAFALYPLGKADAMGDLNWFTQISGDPAQVGLRWVFQAGLLGSSGVNYLTNSVTRTIGL